MVHRALLNSKSGLIRRSSQLLIVTAALGATWSTAPAAHADDAPTAPANPAPAGPGSPPAPGATPTPGTTPPGTPAAAPAAPPPAPVTGPNNNGLQVSGSIDTYYDYNTNSPGGSRGGAPATGTTPAIPGTSVNRLNQLQNWTFHANQFSLPLAEVVLAENPDPAKNPLGFKVVLAYGDATDWIHSFPTPNAAGNDESKYKNILQAYGTYIAQGKTSKPTTISLGKFVTWAGYEVIETQANPNYTHGLLFSFAIPYYHTGLSISRPLTSKLTGTFYLVNGWNNVVDNNNGKTLGYSLSFTPNSKLNIITNGIFGPENTDDEGDWRKLTDNIITFTPNSKLSLIANYDYGADHNGKGGPNVKWQGIAAYLHYLTGTKSAVTARGELFSDPNGFAISAPGNAGSLAGVTIPPPSGGQEAKEATLTYEYHFHPRIITRFEVREDWSTQPVFAKGSFGTQKTQTQFVIGNIFTF